MAPDVSGTPENPPSPLSEDARKALAMVHEGWDHLRRQRPLAAWASWQRALRIVPEHTAAQQALDHLAIADDLPAAARVPYRFRPPRGDEPRARWDAALRSRDMEDLRIAAEVFGSLADADPSDAPARYNQALCLAWLGENVSAIEALDLVVRAEAAHDFEAAVGAWTLAEILRQGAGAEHLADDLSHTLSFDWPSDKGDPIVKLAGSAELRPVPAPSGPDSSQPAYADARAFEWLDRRMPEPAPTLKVDQLPRVQASVIATPGTLRFSSPDRDRLHDAEVHDVEHHFGCTVAEGGRPFDRRSTPLPLVLLDAAVWQFRLPDGLDETSRHRLTREAAEHYFEDEWIQQPRQALARLDRSSASAVSPRDASLVTDRVDRSIAWAKLEAVIRVREQLAARPKVAALYAGYPFDRLRRRLGLDPLDPATLDPADVSCMGIAELDRLETSMLDQAMLREAFRSASAWPDMIIAGRLALAIVERDPLALPDLAGRVCEGLRNRRHVDRALDVVDRAIILLEEANDRRGLARVENLRALLLSEIDRWPLEGDILDDPESPADEEPL